MSLFNHITLVLHPDYKGLEQFMLSLSGRFEREEGELVYKGRNILRKFEYQGTVYVVKAFRTPNLINRFVYGLLRPSKAKRSYENALRFHEIGVGTPFPVGYINVRKGLLFDRSYYVTLVSACTHTYNELFYNKFDYEDDVIRAVARTSAQLHEHGYAHLDYGRGNILFEQTAEGIKIEVVDLNRLAIGPLNLKKGCKNMERLPATPHMHKVFAEEYARLRGFDAEECYKWLVAYRSVQPGKIDDKY